MSGKTRRDPSVDSLAAGPRRRERADPFLPLINVVYLLLTFFLLVCALRIGETVPFLPNKGASAAPVQSGAVTLDVGANGDLRFLGRTMPVAEAVIAIRAALAAVPRGALAVRADRKTPVSTILPLLRKLRDGGIPSIRVVPVRRSGPA
jgi:biopolymer transport protein ExbD